MLGKKFDNSVSVSKDNGRYRKGKKSRKEIVSGVDVKDILSVPKPMTLAECTDYLKPIASLIVSYMEGKYGDSSVTIEDDCSLVQIKINKNHPDGVLSIRYDNPELDQIIKIKLSPVGEDGSFHVYTKLHYRKGEIDDNQHTSGYNFLHMKFVPGNSNYLGMDMEKCILYAGETRDLAQILHKEVNQYRIISLGERSRPLPILLRP